jgi:hypothetical protein
LHWLDIYHFFAVSAKFFCPDFKVQFFIDIFTYNLKPKKMTRKEAWKVLLDQLDDLGMRMNELVEDQLDENDDLNRALMGLRMAHDELSEQEIKDYDED